MPQSRDGIRAPFRRPEGVARSQSAFCPDRRGLHHSPAEAQFRTRRPDAPCRSLRRLKHCRGVRPAIRTLLPALPAHRQGISRGAPRATVPLSGPELPGPSDSSVPARACRKCLTHAVGTDPISPDLRHQTSQERTRNSERGTRNYLNNRLITRPSSFSGPGSSNLELRTPNYLRTLRITWPSTFSPGLMARSRASVGAISTVVTESE
jgi:hypothetical protein